MCACMCWEVGVGGWVGVMGGRGREVNWWMNGDEVGRLGR